LCFRFIVSKYCFDDGDNGHAGRRISREHYLTSSTNFGKATTSLEMIKQSIAYSRDYQEPNQRSATHSIKPDPRPHRPTRHEWNEANENNSQIWIMRHSPTTHQE